MNRRTAFKNLVLASGTFITLPSWVVAIGLADKPGFETSFTQEEQRVLSAVADTIIPAGSAIGAISVGVDKYLLKVFDDCYEPEITTAIKKQLHNLEGSAVTAYSKSYTDLSYELRLQVLLNLSTSSLKEDQDFFKLIKSETIRGFNTSREVMVGYLGYKVAPGHYYGSVDLKKS